MNEVIFAVEQDDNGDYKARALNYNISTEGGTVRELKDNIGDAVLNHFDDDDLPQFIRMRFENDEALVLA